MESYVVKATFTSGGKPMTVYAGKTCDLRRVAMSKSAAATMGRQAATLLAQSFNNEITEAELSGRVSGAPRFVIEKL